VSTGAQLTTQSVSLVFKDKSFCFTGALAGLKRTPAEREVRARGGLSMDSASVNLDNLVVGEKGSAFWKHGSYGTKIEKSSTTLSRTHRPSAVGAGIRIHTRPRREYAPEASGDIQSKVLVGVYKFFVKANGVIDAEVLQRWLVGFRDSQAVHVRARKYDYGAYRDLLSSEGNEGLTGTLVEVRFVKQMTLDESPRILADEILKGFESIQGVDGHFHWAAT
jgi:hypothetical protein